MSRKRINLNGPSQRTSLCVSILACFLLVADGTLVLYATLLWPPTPDGPFGPDPLLVVGVVTFVVCFTLPFVLAVALMVSGESFLWEKQVENRGDIMVKWGVGTTCWSRFLGRTVPNMSFQG